MPKTSSRNQLILWCAIFLSFLYCSSISATDFFASSSDAAASLCWLTVGGGLSAKRRTFVVLGSIWPAPRRVLHASSCCSRSFLSCVSFATCPLSIATASRDSLLADVCVAAASLPSPATMDCSMKRLVSSRSCSRRAILSRSKSSWLVSSPRVSLSSWLKVSSKSLFLCFSLWRTPNHASCTSLFLSASLCFLAASSISPFCWSITWSLCATFSSSAEIVDLSWPFSATSTSIALLVSIRCFSSPSLLWNSSTETFSLEPAMNLQSSSSHLSSLRLHCSSPSTRSVLSASRPFTCVRFCCSSATCSFSCSSLVSAALR
mmetsp:Transcript_20268/g.77591  ORF Transcript_20268/g.77591 Transcript_20268/m.77591 type:complete len:319 (-) Transcript_20268:1044-2000(-)